MIYIAHRGNINGPNVKENHPDHIREALALGFHVEVDVWYLSDGLYLGHDSPMYKVDRDFFDWRFWCHCKNFEALSYFKEIDGTGNQFQYFWHDKDNHTLTSNGYIWTDPNCAVGKNSIAVMPEYVDSTLENVKNLNCYGVCSDYVAKIREAIR